MKPMEDLRTVLTTVKSGNIWRVRIAWPNGKANYFGKFNSEKDAVEWIAAHPKLTKPLSIADRRLLKESIVLD
jgi:hypothetical protein